MDNIISNESNLNALLGFYCKDREEEKEHKNRIHNLFTTFILLFLGATNAFMQVKDPIWPMCLIFIISINGASGLYWYLHNEMMTRLMDAAKIKEGREILIKLLLNNTNVQKYKNNLSKEKMKEPIKVLEERIQSPDYPFIAFNDIIELKIRHEEEQNKKYAVLAIGIIVSVLTLGFFLLKQGYAGRP